MVEETDAVVSRPSADQSTQMGSFPTLHTGSWASQPRMQRDHTGPASSPSLKTVSVGVFCPLALPSLPAVHGMHGVHAAWA